MRCQSKPVTAMCARPRARPPLQRAQQPNASTSAGRCRVGAPGVQQALRGLLPAGGRESCGAGYVSLSPGQRRAERARPLRAPMPPGRHRRDTILVRPHARRCSTTHAHAGVVVDPDEAAPGVGGHRSTCTTLVPRSRAGSRRRCAPSTWAPRTMRRRTTPAACPSHGLGPRGFHQPSSARSPRAGPAHHLRNASRGATKLGLRIDGTSTRTCRGLAGAGPWPPPWPVAEPLLRGDDAARAVVGRRGDPAPASTRDAGPRYPAASRHSAAWVACMTALPRSCSDGIVSKPHHLGNRFQSCRSVLL